MHNRAWLLAVVCAALVLVLPVVAMHSTESDQSVEQSDIEADIESEVEADAEIESDSESESESASALDAILSHVTGASGEAFSAVSDDDGESGSAAIAKGSEPECPGKPNKQLVDDSAFADPINSDYSLCKKAVWKCGVHFGHCMRTCVGRADNYTIKQCKGLCDPQKEHCYGLIKDRFAEK